MLIQGDDNLDNSDWIKTRTWDLPYENLEQYLRNYAPGEQKAAVRHLMELPVFRAAPPVFRVQAEAFVAGSALKYADGEFIVKGSEDQPRDENGRWTDSGAAGASSYPSQNWKLASERRLAAERAWLTIRDKPETKYILDKDAYRVLDPVNNSPETLAAYEEYRQSAAALWGSQYWENWEGDAVYSVEGEWLKNNFATVDSMGNPTDPGVVVGPARYGADLELWKLRDEYVVPDEKTLKMNASLRDGRSSTKADRIDQWVNSSTITESVALYRGATLSPEQVDTLRPGFSYVDKGFQSTGATTSEAEFYLGVRQKADEAVGRNVQPVLMRYVVEPGTHVANAGYGEFVVQRNTTNTVIGRNEVDGVTYITVGVRGNG
jgi:hypothetical protein